MLISFVKFSRVYPVASICKEDKSLLREASRSLSIENLFSLRFFRGWPESGIESLYTLKVLFDIKGSYGDSLSLYSMLIYLFLSLLNAFDCFLIAGSTKPLDFAVLFKIDMFLIVEFMLLDTIVVWPNFDNCCFGNILVLSIVGFHGFSKVLYKLESLSEMCYVAIDTYWGDFFVPDLTTLALTYTLFLILLATSTLPTLLITWT